MNHKKRKHKISLYKKYPPSEPCSCEICMHYCQRPGWWTVEEAQKAIEAGYANRMMLEMSPERDFGVLSPSFNGNECDYALQYFSNNGCTFLFDGLCELHGTGLLPLECGYCHHERKGMGIKCHLDIEKDWNSDYGKRLIIQWSHRIDFLKRRKLITPIPYNKDHI